MSESTIFTQAELKEIDRQEKKDYSDRFGLFSRRIKPKILEILNVWLPKKKDLKKLMQPKRKPKALKKSNQG